MKKNFLAIAALTVFFGACTKTDAPLKADALQKSGVPAVSELSQSAAKFKNAPGAINITGTGVYPEGMVYNPFKDEFLVSSISMGTIGAVTREGDYSAFITDTDLASTAGMEIDKAHKRLLVTSSRANGSVAKLAIYDLNTKNRLFLIDLKALAGDAPHIPHLANDVAIDQQGNAYVTDSYAGKIYKVDRNGNASIFYDNPAYTPGPQQFGFNGIEFSSSKGGYLLVAHTALAQVLRIPVNNPAAATTVQFTPAITSPDGLLLSKNSKQLIVVNNTAQYEGSNVMSFETSNSWATASATAPAVGTGVVYPTTLTSDGKTEYVLYSNLHLLFGGVPSATFSIQPLQFSSNNPF